MGNVQSYICCLTRGSKEKETDMEKQVIPYLVGGEVVLAPAMNAARAALERTRFKDSVKHKSRERADSAPPALQRTVSQFNRDCLRLGTASLGTIPRFSCRRSTKKLSTTRTCNVMAEQAKRVSTTRSCNVMAEGAKGISTTRSCNVMAEEAKRVSTKRSCRVMMEDGVEDYESDRPFERSSQPMGAELSKKTEESLVFEDTVGMDISPARDGSIRKFVITSAVATPLEEGMTPTEGARIEFEFAWRPYEARDEKGDPTEGWALVGSSEPRKMSLVLGDCECCDALESTIVAIMRGERCVARCGIGGTGDAAAWTDKRLGFGPQSARGIDMLVSLLSVEKEKDVMEMEPTDRAKYASERKDAAAQYMIEQRYTSALNNYKLVCEVLDYIEDIRDPAAQNEVGTLKRAAKLNEGLCHLKLEDWTNTIRECSDILKDDAASEKALCRRAKAHLKQGHFSHVEADLKRCLANNPNNNEAFRLFVQCKSEAAESGLHNEAGIGFSGVVDGDMVQAKLLPIHLVVSGIFQFAILTRNGSVVTGGDMLRGGDNESVMEELKSGVKNVFSACQAFAVLCSTGSVVTWGHDVYGGNSNEVKDMLISGVLGVYSADGAFAALKAGCSVVTWGAETCGGDSAAVKEELQSGVQRVYSNRQAFAALKTAGSLVTWGSNHYGGHSMDVRDQLQRGVVRVFFYKMAFAALESNGSIVTWGDKYCGGDSAAVKHAALSNVQHVFSNHVAFAALKFNGSVGNWGDHRCGGDSMDVKDELQSGVLRVYSTVQAFAALKRNRSVVTWGADDCGGDSSAVKDDLHRDVKHVYSTLLAFAAWKASGSVVTWSDQHYGGDSSDVDYHLESGVLHMYSTTHAFAALKAKGSVVTWGAHDFGGDSTDVKEALQGGVQHVFTFCYDIFAAVTANGFLVTWGRNARHVKNKLERCRPRVHSTVHSGRHALLFRMVPNTFASLFTMPVNRIQMEHGYSRNLVLVASGIRMSK